MPAGAKYDMMRYFLKQEMMRQKKFVSYSMSRGWLWKGYRKYFKKLVREFGFEKGLQFWYEFLDKPFEFDRFLMEKYMALETYQ